MAHGRTRHPRTAKSCGPDASTPASSRQECFRILPVMVTRKPGSPGRARRKPLKPLARGMPGYSGVTVLTTLVRLLFFAREAAGANRAPGIPCALRFRGAKGSCTTRARLRRENAGLRHHRACPGDPRLPFAEEPKTWMAGSSPAMTEERAATTQRCLTFKLPWPKRQFRSCRRCHHGDVTVRQSPVGGRNRFASHAKQT
jgi:hypothetical protein